MDERRGETMLGTKSLGMKTNTFTVFASLFASLFASQLSATYWRDSTLPLADVWVVLWTGG